MEIHEKITNAFATLRPIHFKKFHFFSTTDSDNFDEDRYIESTTQFFRALDDFSSQFVENEALEIDETFLKQCDDLITALATEDLEAYLSATNDFTSLLNIFFQPIASARDLDVPIVPTDMNRRMLDEGIRPQQGIINKQGRKFRNEINRDKFEDLKKELKGVREKYEDQLFKNIVLVVDVREIEKCKENNDDLEKAERPFKFLKCMEEAKVFFEDSIKKLPA